MRKLKFLSFNIRVSTIKDILNGHSWWSRSRLVRDTVLKNDVIGFQEVRFGRLFWIWWTFRKSYHIIWGKFSFIYPTNPILVRRADDIDVFRKRIIWLNSKPLDEYSFVEPRSLTSVYIRVGGEHTGTEFVVMNTHLDHRQNNKGQLFYASLLLGVSTMYDELGVPQVLMGDLNATEDSDLLKSLSVVFDNFGNKRFKDFRRTEFWYDRPVIEGGYLPVDFILTRGISRKGVVYSTYIKDVKASDHYAVRKTISF